MPDSAAPRLVLAASATTSRDEDLAPSWQTPWNPERPLAKRRAWETAILLPQRIVTYPLTVVGEGVDRLLLYTEETAFFQRASFVSRELPGRFGFGVKPARLGDRTGFGVGLQARSIFLSGALKNSITLEHSASTRNYHRTTLRLFGRPASLQYGYEWRPEEPFYGLGASSSYDSSTGYAAQFEHLRGQLTFGWNRDTKTHEPMTETTFWLGPRSMVTRIGHEDGIASFEQFHPDLAATRLDRRVEHMAYGVGFSTDWRVGSPHWARGWRVRFEAERFDKPWGAIALRNPGGDGAQFTRTTAEIETGVSFLRDPRTLRLLVRVIDVGITSGAERMQFQDLSSLGGRDGLGGFKPGRFHDVDQALARVSYVFPLQRRFEVLTHVDVGQVTPDVWRTTRFDELQTSYGVHLRGRGRDDIYGSVGVEWSVESIRLRWRLGGER